METSSLSNIGSAGGHDGDASETKKPWSRKKQSLAANDERSSHRDESSTYANGNKASQSPSSSLAANIRLWRRKADSGPEVSPGEPEKSRFSISKNDTPPTPEPLSSSAILQGAISAASKSTSPPDVGQGESSQKALDTSSSSASIHALKPPSDRDTFVSLIDRCSNAGSGSALGKNLDETPKTPRQTLDSLAELASTTSSYGNGRLWRRKADSGPEVSPGEPEKSRFSISKNDTPPTPEPLSSSAILQGAASAAMKLTGSMAPQLFSGESSQRVVGMNSSSVSINALKPPSDSDTLFSLIDRDTYEGGGSILGKYLKESPKPSSASTYYGNDQNSKGISHNNVRSFDRKSQSAFRFHQQSNDPTVLGSNIKSIFDKNLRMWKPTDVNNRMEGDNLDIATGADDAPVSELTEGERRYLQYQERLRIQRTEFAEKLPPSTNGDSFVKNVQREPEDFSVFSATEFKHKLSQSLKFPEATSRNEKSGGSEKSTMQPVSQRSTVVKEITVPVAGMSIRDLASTCSMKLKDVIAKLNSLGEEESEHEFDDRVLDADIVELLVLELGFEAKREAPKRDIESRPSITSTNQTLVSRAPLVSVMGHVDHGKTTLLDSLRKASVAASEAGGITQKLSAFTVPVKNRHVVFLDTPGHAAFTAMRAHGAAATDIVILVVALDDGVRPQTKEAIRVAKDAGCSIVVALNKVDKIPAGSEREKARLRVLTELLELDLVAESFGGDVQVVEVSGKTGDGLDTLVEGVLLQADVLDLKAACTGMAECTVLEAYMEKGRGVVCELLVRWGRLNVGDNVVVGTTYGKIKAMTDDAGKSLKSAGPSSAVRLVGLRAVPQAGQELITVESEARARMIVERRERVLELRNLKHSVVSDISGQVSSPLQIDVLLKADGHGTLDALQRVVSELGNMTGEVKVNILGGSVGDITRGDIDTASTSQNACILGFNIGNTNSVIRELAKKLDIPIFRDTVIYRLEDALRDIIAKMMPKTKVLETQGRAKVLKLFEFSGKGGPIRVAGVHVTSGSIKSNKSGKEEYVFRIFRNGNLIADDIENAELKRFKDIVHEVESGNECGLSFDSYKDIEAGDEIECLRVDWITKSLITLEEDKEPVAQQMAA